MKSLSLLLLFTQLSTQLPWPQGSSELVSRGHTYSPHTSNLKRMAPSTSRSLRRRQWGDWGDGKPSTTGGSAAIIDNERLKYLLPVTIGNQTLDLEIDTGSSDTWAIQTGFKCFKTSNTSTFAFLTPEPDSFCNFGPSFTPGESFQPLNSIVQYSCYGQGNEGTKRCVGGEFGKVTVNILVVQIPQQIVGAPKNVMLCHQPLQCPQN